MPHQRARHIQPIFEKRLKLWPVIGLLGTRQVGKSTFLRDIFSKTRNIPYFTFDRQDIRNRALNAPDLFVEHARQEGPRGVVIDEITKVPDLFDAIKLSVDERRRPGTFVVSGSAQFSQKLGIRESLTGRIGILRLWPMSTAELKGVALRTKTVTQRFSPSGSSLGDITRAISKGGMPGVAFLRSEEERKEAVRGWNETTCFRDLLQVRRPRLSGQLAFEILTLIPTLEQATAGALAQALKVDVRRISGHLEALETILAVNRLDPHPAGTGKSEFQVVDSGFHQIMGGSFFGALKLWVVNEIRSQHAATGSDLSTLKFYQSRRQSWVDLILGSGPQMVAFILSQEQSVSAYHFRAGAAFLKKFPTAKVIYLSPCSEAYRENKIHIVPWNWLC